MEALDKYIETFSSPEDALLKELERETYLRVLNPRMISGHIQGKLMEMIVRMTRPQRVLEIGTFTGYSALCMAAGLPEGGLIDTCEVDDELEMMILSFFERSAHGKKIRLHIGSALDIAPSLSECYDLVFIDGDKREYTAYYEMLFDNGLVKSGSWILADNILWYGKVVEPVAKGDKQTQAIIDFNAHIVADPRVENVILPIRDGINLIRVK
ncbi:MAG: class I SAM-dependent methyltransferase [Alistipes sp.]|nr:class I SAM-dependent methyltransferase [Alistipes sp.]MBR0393697.1 class I SAM-dependent methyltransferase [Alistipes sp.]